MTLTERWQNVYEGLCITVLLESKEQADYASSIANAIRTHYLKTYWKEGIMQSVELVPINND